MSSKQLKRKPKQHRSAATVAVIIEAAAQVLLEYDYASATTNRIAERGGVSVGSIYQYFRNKEEIFDALLDRYVAETIEAVEQVDLASQQDIGGTVEVLTLTFLHAWPQGPELLRRLSQAPGPHFREALDQAKCRLRAFVLLVLAKFDVRPDVPDLDVALKLLIDAAEGAFVGLSSGQDPEQFAAEISRLVTRYLGVT